MKHLSFIFLLSIVYCASAQELQVLDKATLRPIGFALIYNVDTTISIQGNHEGKAILNTFRQTDTLVFRHSAYETEIFTISELTKQDFKVFLKEKVIKINEIVISAGKWEQSKSDVPNRITIISPDKIFYKNPQTMADALRQSGEVFVQKSQQGGGSPMIRGFSANSLLIVADGVRMNNAIFRSGNLQNVILLDANMIEKIEIINGPGSVIYGSDALGGVLSFQTLSPEKGPIHGMAFSRVSTANWEKTGHFHLSTGNEKLGWVGALTYSDFGNLRSGRQRNHAYPDFGKREYYIIRSGDTDSILANKNPNVQRFSGYSQINVTQKLQFEPTAGFKLNYGFHYTTGSNIPRYDRLIEESSTGEPINAEWYYGPQKWMLHMLGMELPKKGMFDHGKIIMAYQNVEESRHSRKYRKNLLKSQIEKVHAFSTNADFKKQVFTSQSLFYGIEFTYNRVNSSAHHLDIVSGVKSATDTRYPAGGSNYYTAAGYLSWQSFLSSKFILNGGLRYNHTRMLAKGSDGEYSDFSFQQLNTQHGAINGNLGLVFKLNEGLKLNTLISTGFRSPNVDDVGKLFDVTDNYVVVPNPNLKSEYLYNVEAGLEKTFNQKINIGAVGYCSILKNAMVRRDFKYNGSDSIIHDGKFKKAQSLINIGEAHIFGGSFHAKADVNKWLSLTSSLNFVIGEDVVEKVPLRHASPIFGSSSAIVNVKKIKAELDISYNGPKKWENMPPDELAKPHLYTPEGSLAWTVFSIYSNYQFNRNLTFQFDVENIFDIHYRPYSSGISAPGRNFVFALKCLF